MSKGKNLAKAGDGKAIEAVVPAALTAKQQDLCDRANRAVAARPRRPAVGVAKKVLELGVGDTAVLDRALAREAFGSASVQILNHLVSRIASTIESSGEASSDGDAAAAAIALVAAVEPRNELEATMAVQMVAANEAALLCFRRMNGAQLINQMSAYSAMANKAMRSFALHVETLAKLRRGGEQVVRHVHVNEGGQAVIAHTVNAKGGGGE